MVTVPSVQPAPFDYRKLSRVERSFLRHRAKEIRQLSRRVAGDIFKMGQKFAEVRDALRHNKTGGFERWWASEGFKKQFVYNCIGVYETFLNCPNFGQLDIAISALYLLILPSTRPEILQEIITRAQSGEEITYTNVLNATATPALPAPATPLAQPLRFQPGMVARCKHCDWQFPGREAGDPVYPFDQWVFVEPKLWRCPQKHRVSDVLMLIVATDPPAPVTPPIITESGKSPNYTVDQRAWCANCADWQHFIGITSDTWRCKHCAYRVQDDVIEAWSPEGEASRKPKTGAAPASRSVATSSVSAFIPGSGSLPPVSAPPVLSLPKFRVILTDPPWQYEKYADPDGRGTAESHYPTMPMDEIRAVPVASLADDNCALFMWVTWPVMDQAFGVAAAWGFQYKTAAFVWAKTNKRAAERMSIVSSDSNWFFGMGSWSRANTEACLLFTKGQPQRIAADVRQLIVAPISDHSRKPVEQYERIERLLKGPYVELFARQERAGWTSWGLEIEGGSVTSPAEAAR